MSFQSLATAVAIDLLDARDEGEKNEEIDRTLDEFFSTARKDQNETYRLSGWAIVSDHTEYGHYRFELERKGRMQEIYAVATSFVLSSNNELQKSDSHRDFSNQSCRGAISGISGGTGLTAARQRLCLLSASWVPKQHGRSFRNALGARDTCGPQGYPRGRRRPHVRLPNRCSGQCEPAARNTPHRS